MDDVNLDDKGLETDNSAWWKKKTKKKKKDKDKKKAGKGYTENDNEKSTRD